MNIPKKPILTKEMRFYRDIYSKEPVPLLPKKITPKRCFLGGGVVQWGTRQPGMKKVLLGESEVLTPVNSII